MENPSQKTPYIFRAVPFQLLRCHQLLQKNDRDVLTQILAFGPVGCFYSVDYWTSHILQSGEDGFYRSLYKLELLGLIAIDKGFRGRSSLYRWVSDPSRWKLPKELQKRFQDDRLKLKLPPIEFAEGFEHTAHFYRVFNLKHPRYAVNIETVELIPENAVEPTELSVSFEVISPKAVFMQKMTDEVRSSNSLVAVIRKYYFNGEGIRDLQNWKLGLNPSKNCSDDSEKYYEAIIERLDYLKANAVSDFDKKVLAVLAISFVYLRA